MRQASAGRTSRSRESSERIVHGSVGPSAEEAKAVIIIKKKRTQSVARVLPIRTGATHSSLSPAKESERFVLHRISWCSSVCGPLIEFHKSAATDATHSADHRGRARNDEPLGAFSVIAFVRPPFFAQIFLPLPLAEVKKVCKPAGGW